MPVEPGSLKCVFTYRDTGEPYATLSVIGLIAHQPPAANLILIPVVLDDVLYTAVEYAGMYGDKSTATQINPEGTPLKWEVYDAYKGPEGNGDTKCPFWFQVFFDAYLTGRSLDFCGAEVPVWLKTKLEHAVAEGTLKELSEDGKYGRVLTVSIPTQSRSES